MESTPLTRLHLVLLEPLRLLFRKHCCIGVPVCCAHRKGESPYLLHLSTLDLMSDACPQSCKTFSLVHQLLFVATQLLIIGQWPNRVQKTSVSYGFSSAVLLIMRTYAIYGRSRKMLAFLILVIFAMIGACGVSIYYQVIHTKSKSDFPLTVDFGWRGGRIRCPTFRRLL
jgi:hypothetical protein